MIFSAFFRSLPHNFQHVSGNFPLPSASFPLRPSDAALVRDGEGVAGAHGGGTVQGNRTRARGEGARAWGNWSWFFRDLNGFFIVVASG